MMPVPVTPEMMAEYAKRFGGGRVRGQSLFGSGEGARPAARLIAHALLSLAGAAAASAGVMAASAALGVPPEAALGPSVVAGQIAGYLGFRGALKDDASARERPGAVFALDLAPLFNEAARSRRPESPRRARPSAPR